MASRLTFREKTSNVCWQKLLRDKFLDEPAPLPASALDLKNAVVRPVSRALARQVILKYEWLGTMADSSRHFGIFFGPYCAGATCVALEGGGSAGAAKHKQFGIRKKELATLTRGACVHWAPPGTNSKLIGWTLRLLARAKAAKLVLAFSDSDAGEVGTVYQASNWTYIGPTTFTKGNLLVAPSGRVVNIINVSHYAKRRRTTFRKMYAALREHGWRPQDANPKGRYVYVLDRNDKALVTRIAVMSRPYPRRKEGGGGSKGLRPGSSRKVAVQSRPLRSRIKR